ncbi:MAG: hypothetical protein J2P13_00910, partial [Acidobacteria bacterium]|nr:hypothetical protein [Acidobacteriota bacterium]
PARPKKVRNCCPLAAPTMSGYKQNWESKIKASFVNVPLRNLSTKHVSDLLTHCAKTGLGRDDGYPALFPKWSR